MNITKTTINFAEKRNLEIIIESDGITIWDMNDDDEWLASYKEGAVGLFFNACLMNQNTKEELPYWIQDEKQLRQTIEFLSKEIH
jgi:GH35 family endo-1,4-beta-xylanase